MTTKRVENILKDPKKALFKLAWPIIIGMVVQLAYNVADTAFVGRLGTEAIAAITFAFPLFFIMTALSAGLSSGVNSRISRYLGAKNIKGAENTGMHGIILSIIISVVVFIPGIIFLEDIFQLFGADQTTMDLGVEYMSIILMGIFFMFPGFVLGGIFSAQGDTKTPMRVQIISVLINIILDPIFIYVLDFGIRGAAIATVIAFIFTLVFLIIHARKKSDLEIKMSSFKFSPTILKEILVIGIPSTLMILTISIYVIFINYFMAHYSTNHVAAFGIVSRLESISVMPTMGIAMAMMTIVGMLHGATYYDKLKTIIWYGTWKTVIYTTVVGILFFVMPSFFTGIFTNDKELIAITAPYLRIDVFTFPLMAISMMMARSMQGMGMGMPGLIIQLVRTTFIVIPLAYIFVFVLGYGYLSIAIAMVMGGIASNIIGTIWLEIKLRKLKTSPQTVGTESEPLPM